MVQRVTRTTEEDVEKLDLKFQCPNCERNIPYESSLATHRRLLCKPPPSSAEKCLSPCPSVCAKIAVRKWDDLGRFDWHMSTVARVQNGKRMYVSAEYFEDEPREPLRLVL